MILTLDNGQTVTIYEDGNLLREIQPYIDKEIFDLLEDKFGFIQTTTKDINVVTCGSEIIGQTIRYCELANNIDLDHNIIATEEGSIMMLDANSYDEDSSVNIRCFNKEQFDRVIINYKYIRDELLKNEIISKEYVNNLLIEEKKKNDEKEAKLKDKKYQEYLKLKKEFEINE